MAYRYRCVVYDMQMDQTNAFVSREGFQMRPEKLCHLYILLVQYVNVTHTVFEWT